MVEIVCPNNQVVHHRRRPPFASHLSWRCSGGHFELKDKIHSEKLSPIAGECFLGSGYGRESETVF
jgi:hypothetical protein